MGRYRADYLAIISQMSGQVSRGSAGEYQADERVHCSFHEVDSVYSEGFKGNIYFSFSLI